MESLSPQVVSAAKLPIINPNEFDLWKMRIEHYFLMTDYSLWGVILNGDSPALTRVIEGVVQPVAPTTAEQRLARKNKLKARGTLLMALPDKYQLKFNIHKDAKTLMEAIEKSAVASVSAASLKIPVSALPNVNTLSNAIIYSFFASQSNSPQLDNDDLNQIDADDLEEMDLKCYETDDSLPASPIYDTGDGYHTVPPPYTGTFMPLKPDLVFHDAPNVNETDHTAFMVELSPTKPNKDLSHTHRPPVPIIEDWVSDSEDDSEAEILQNALSFVHPTKQVKTPSLLNRKACFVCKSLTYLIKDYDYYDKKVAQTPARNHVQRGNHQQYARMTLPNPQRHVVPTAVLTKSKLVQITTARPVTTAVPKTHVTRPRPAQSVVTKPHSPRR
nr:hypothetical protein [Tanacetum cinerariifolium]